MCTYIIYTSIIIRFAPAPPASLMTSRSCSKQRAACPALPEARSTYMYVCIYIYI